MRILSLDPGHTTGYSVWDFPDDILGKRQLKYTEDISVYLLDAGTFPYHYDVARLTHEWSIERVVFEEFRLYGHKAATQVGSDLATVQVIGILKYICKIRGIKWFKNMAVNAKKAVTDDTLKRHNVWEYKIPASVIRHARDSMRHAIYYLNFGVGKESDTFYE